MGTMAAGCAGGAAIGVASGVGGPLDQAWSSYEMEAHARPRSDAHGRRFHFVARSVLRAGPHAERSP